jgi:hypothetical protein
MNEPTLVCPHCKNEVHLTESLAAPLLASARAEFAKKLIDKDLEIEAREKKAREAESKIVEERRKLDETVAERLTTKLSAERTRIAAEEAHKAQQASSLDLEAAKKTAEQAQALLKDREARLAVAQKAEADFLKKSGELETEKRELDLTIQKTLQAERTQILENAKKQAEDGLKLTLSEKDQMIQSMKSKIDDLQKKVEQGSQQLQGEVLELELEAILRQAFPIDSIDPVPKGEFGGDVLHGVALQNGQRCGTILWETKRTRTWNDQWLAKLRQDQRTAKADVCVIVSQALPKGIEHFGIIENVWVVSLATITPVAIALRHSLAQVHGAAFF